MKKIVMMLMVFGLSLGTSQVCMANSPPVYSGSGLGEVHLPIGIYFSYQIDTSGFSDPDVDTLTYGVSLIDGRTVDWLGIDSTGTLYGTAPSMGTYLYLKVWAVDPSGAASNYAELLLYVDQTVIQASAGEGGSIDPAGDIIFDDSGVALDTDFYKTFAITPDDGYVIADVVVNEISVGAVSSYEFAFHSRYYVWTDWDEGYWVPMLPQGLFSIHATFAPEGGANQPPQIVGITADPTQPVPVNTAVGVAATFTDPDVGDTHAATWDWGDGTTSDGVVNENNQTFDGSHAYSAAGVYTVTLTVTDAAGESDTATYEYVVVYDPAAGFVTGGGWINSPAGAYVLDPLLSGKATFGFVSKYQKGATVPTGNTQFQFNAGDLNFHSTNYDWLVVTGANYANFKGTGTIDGLGSFKFKLWAGNGPDTFRIKIWSEDGAGVETVVYDNGSDQAISGGNIVVHLK